MPYKSWIVIYPVLQACLDLFHLPERGFVKLQWCLLLDYLSAYDLDAHINGTCTKIRWYCGQGYTHGIYFPLVMK